MCKPSLLGDPLPMDSVSNHKKDLKRELYMTGTVFIRNLNITLSLHVFLSLMCTCTCILLHVKCLVLFTILLRKCSLHQQKEGTCTCIHVLFHTVFGYSTCFVYSSPLCIYIIHVRIFAYTVVVVTIPVQVP